jgi:hypothetical protein
MRKELTLSWNIEDVEGVCLLVFRDGSFGKGGKLCCSARRIWLKDPTAVTTPVIPPCNN